MSSGTSGVSGACGTSGVSGYLKRGLSDPWSTTTLASGNINATSTSYTASSLYKQACL